MEEAGPSLSVRIKQELLAILNLLRRTMSVFSFLLSWFSWDPLLLR